MYKAKQEIQFDGRVFQAGDEVPNPTTRMLDLGLVELVQEAKVEEPIKSVKPTSIETKVSKSKSSKKEKLKEEILFEDSATVEVVEEDQTEE